MVKCPRGSPSQIKANLAYINRRSPITSSNDFMKGQLEKENEILLGESEGSELDSIRADKRCPPTARDELVYFFVSSFLDILLESWDGKPCVKQKLGHQYDRNYSEEFGEDLGPCEISITSSTAEYLKDLYQKRSSNLLKEKTKKDSESVESEYLNEEDYESSMSSGRWKHTTDEEVHFVLVNGVWYKGRVSRRLMEGEGYYFWEDGSTFQGEFEGGCVTGKGRLEFPDLSTYEGGVYRGFRHGEGMFCFSNSPVMYSGQWWLGKKHGHGLIVYNDPSEGHNFYTGQWQNGLKEGFGFRQYPSGAKYVGFWSRGKRHGRGVMFWSNHDIYRGEWKEGLMHGYGEYTWNGFVNKSLSYPASNTYRGFWENGKRNGRGLFELKSGSFIETTWVDNMKEGSGAVICLNGDVVTSETLFKQDQPAVEEANVETPLKGDASKKAKKPKGISIPISSPVHTLNLYPHIEKLLDQLNKINFKNQELARMEFNFEGVTPKPSEDIVMTESHPPTSVEAPKCKAADLQSQWEKEQQLLRNYIILMINDLRDSYDFYSKLSCEQKPPFRCVLLRLFLWQMLIDCKVPNVNLSLIDVDAMLEREEYLLIQDPHNPFERIQFWQFIQILIVVSWHLYGQYVLGTLPLVEDEKVSAFLQYFGRSECRNVLKTSLQYFVETHLFGNRPGSGSTLNQANKFEESDFAPMEAMYVIYCNVGEPHSARDFVNALCSKESEDGNVPTIVRYFEKLPFYKVEGKNAFTVAGDLKHIPGNKTFNTPEIFQLERNQMLQEPKSELTCFYGLRARRVIRCLLEVCPGIMEDDCIVNMDYKLTFLEFYKAIILCTKLQLKMKVMNDIRGQIIEDYKVQMEEYKKQLSEFEKQKENQVVSRKKSRQFSDPTKKGKK